MVNSFLLIDVYPDIIKILLIIVLLICSALISGSEVAFFSLSKTDLKKISSSNARNLKLIAILRANPRRLLATLLVSNNFINISIVLLLASFGQLFDFDSLPGWVNFVLEVGFITALILLFGEILPKVYANRKPISFSKKMAFPVQILDKYLFFFITIPMSKMTKFIQDKLVFKKPNLSVDKLSDAFNLTDKSETSSEEKKIFKGIISFGSIEVKQVMKPRIDVFSVSKTMSYTDLIKQVRENRYSRIPVFDETIDNVTGVIYLKDLFPYLNQKNFDWTTLIREPYFIPENKKLDDLLKEFQKLKNHMAIVVDEYGGNSGIITLNDIVEEIVGEINDEFNQDDIVYNKIDNNTFVFEGKVNLTDLYRILKIKDNKIFEKIKGDSETLGGFLLEQIGFFPKKNFKLKLKGIEFKIVEVNRKRIKSIMVVIKK
ncbi:gliding motility-associated protein GldE [Flavobacteriaceae bacterium]|nr:gliding motility-associated protein GldE [Flavobacteriaceae bacterium]MDB4087293.1 gliding motility-associated protein GldE [Flavobacteriaceae bacterium]MDB9787396.1 gliding motility-associated protein GldE [Flavobacteriaceae bacterium]